MGILSLRDDLHTGVQMFLDQAEVRRDVMFDQLDLSGSMARQSGHVAYYGELAARAEHQVAYLKRSLEIMEARLIKNLRAIYAARNDPKVSETRLEKEIRLDPGYIDLQSQLADAKYVQAVTQSVLSALQDRRAMMLQTARSDSQMQYGNPQHQVAA
jgi:hypothetical protein